jgi:hypothetical protein
MATFSLSGGILFTISYTSFEYLHYTLFYFFQCFELGIISIPILQIRKISFLENILLKIILAVSDIEEMELGMFANQDLNYFVPIHPFHGNLLIKINLPPGLTRLKYVNKTCKFMVLNSMLGLWTSGYRTQDSVDIAVV